MPLARSLDGGGQRQDGRSAAYLSGGIDSCAVLGLAQQQLDRPIRAYTLTFENVLYDESALARQQAERVGASFHPVPVTSRDPVDTYGDAVWHAETVFVNGHGVAKFLLSRAVRDAGIKVVFTGEGAEEMLGGYPPFRRDVLLYNNEGQDTALVTRLLAQLQESNTATRGLLTTNAAPTAALDSVRRRLAGCRRGSRSSPTSASARPRCFAPTTWPVSAEWIHTRCRSVRCRSTSVSGVAIRSTRPSTCGPASSCRTSS